MYCKKCGGKLESYASNCAFCGTPVERYETQVNYINEHHRGASEPMTMWRWIGYYMLPIIPVVGGIIQIVITFKWAFGKNDDLTLRGYARAQLIVILLAILLSVAMLLAFFLNPGVLDELSSTTM